MSRKDISDQLNRVYLSDSNDIVILYGSKYVGLKSFINAFVKNKNAFIYKSRQCNSNTQFSILTKEIIESLKKRDVFRNDFENSFRLLINEEKEKKVIIFDDFNSIIKNNKTFLKLIISLIREPQSKNKAMVIFATEDINYIENEMTGDLGDSIYEVNRILKVEALSPYELLKNRKNLSFSDFISYYSVLGGNADIWNLVADDVSPKDFICNNIINRNGLLYSFGKDILPEDLREKSVYNTILYYLADGNTKLNDLHNKCGYDRAKISVYLKNLIKRGMVEKCTSPAIDNCQNEKKGIYRISDSFTVFWYRYIFPYESLLGAGTPEKFFKRYIEPTFNLYRENSYRDVVIDYFNNRDRNQFKYRLARYYDKDDAVDCIGISDDGGLALCGTRFSQPHMAYLQFEKIKDFADKTGLDFDELFLFSAVDFDQKLHLYSSVHENVKLIKYIG